MGMYDDIIVRCNLPGQQPAWAKIGSIYQTKSMECSLLTYELSEDGCLWYEDSKTDFTGIIEFHNSNCRGSSHGFLFTENGEDYESVDYRAQFFDGQIEKIEQICYDKMAALPISALPKPTTGLFFGDRGSREKEQMTGKKFFIVWGGYLPTDGYSATCVAEDDRSVVLKKEGGGFEVLDRWQRDIVFFDSQEGAQLDYDLRRIQQDEARKKLSKILEDNQRARRSTPEV